MTAPGSDHARPYETDLDAALALPGREGVTMRRPTAAHPDCTCGKRPQRPRINDHWLDEPSPDLTGHLTPAERRAALNAWHDRCAAPYKAALAAWELARRCPQHDPKGTP